jgi:NAD(P)-dependent dehydrogenase (short-subunit alcohol dehydrogenase family)
VLIAYLNEDQDAKETQRLVEEAGRKAVLVAGDISAPEHCRAIIDQCVKELGGIDILVNNAAHQASFNRADLIVLATGYKGQEYLVRKLFGRSSGIRRLASISAARDVVRGTSFRISASRR